MDDKSTLLENYWTQNDSYKYVFNETVSTVDTKTVYDYSPGSTSPKIYRTSLYNGNGELIGTIDTLSDGNYVAYDRNNVRYQRGSISNEGYRKSYRYYIDGRDKGRLFTEQVHDQNGKVTSYTKYSYNPSGTQDSLEKYSDGKLIGETKFEYDKEGYLISKKMYYKNDDGDLYLSNEELYDQYGNAVSDRYYHNDGTLYSNNVSEKMVFNGKEYTFNATELRSIMQSLETVKGSYSKILGSIISNCSSIAGTVSSFDSGVSGVINNLGSKCSLCSEKISEFLSNLNTTINDYVVKTVSNEEERARDLESLNSDIEGISAALGSIN